MTIELKPEQEKIVAQAIQAGLIETPDEAADAGVETIRKRLESGAVERPALSDEEWMRKFRAWAYSHPTDTPLLSDEAMGRESIYRDRGL